MESEKFLKIFREICNDEGPDLSELTTPELCLISTRFESKLVQKEIDERVLSCEDPLMLEFLRKYSKMAYATAREILKEKPLKEQMYYLTSRGFVSAEFRGMFDSRKFEDAWFLWDKTLFIEVGRTGLKIVRGYRDYSSKLWPNPIIEEVLIKRPNAIKIPTIDACERETTSGGIFIIKDWIHPVLIFSEKQFELTIVSGHLHKDGKKVDTSMFSELPEYQLSNPWETIVERPMWDAYFKVADSDLDPRVVKIGDFCNLDIHKRNSCWSPDPTGPTNKLQYTHYPNIGIMDLFKVDKE